MPGLTLAAPRDSLPDPLARGPRPPGRPGLFLARGSYRQRRLRDAARMLPVLGLVLWLIPLMWRREAGQTGGMAAAVTVVFVGWGLLIVLTALIVRRLRPEDGALPDDGP